MESTVGVVLAPTVPMLLLAEGFVVIAVWEDKVLCGSSLVIQLSMLTAIAYVYCN